MNDYDVIIVGTGAGGATLARRLAPSGQRILLLERGDWVTDGGATAAETADTWFTDHGSITPAAHYVVGGATKAYGAALHRLRPDDFRETHHYGGISPAWPISYADLEPYYAEAEQLYGVHGTHGEDPTEGPTSRDYPHGPIPHEPRIQQLHDDLTALGLHPAHAPTGILFTEDEHGRRVPTRADAERVGVRAALAHRNVTLLTKAEVVRLETDPAGTRVTGVLVDLDGELERYAAHLVVVACGAANSAKLLLASASEVHPAGLGNSSDELGRNYLGHILQPLLALSVEPNPTVFPKTLMVNDFYGGDGDFGYPMGTIQLMGRPARPEAIRAEPALARRLAGRVSPRQVVEHGVGFLLSTEDLPRSDNRLTRTRAGHLQLRYAPGDLTAARRLTQQLFEQLGRLGMDPEHLIPRPGLTRVGVHQAGTARFGPDPTTSVLDLDCRVHDLDNLYVVDASFMPSIGAVDPALTVLANALRVGDHLLDRLTARVAVAAH